MGFASDVQSEDCDGQKVLLKARSTYINRCTCTALYFIVVY